MAPDIDVHLWRQDGVDTAFMNSAVDAINTMASKLDFNINPVEDYLYEPDVTVTHDNWDRILLEDFKQHLRDTNNVPAFPASNDLYLLIIDDSGFTGPGAGKQIGGTVGTGQNDWFDSNQAVVAGVNAFVKLYINSCRSFASASGEGAFRNTVKHEIAHGLLDGQQQTFPADSCGPQLPNEEHSAGDVYNELVSPMMTWYNSTNCSGNPAPCDSCSGNPDAIHYGYRGLSSCSIQKINYWHNNLYLQS